MLYLVSLPENAKDVFHKLSGKSKENWFCTSDPKGTKLGSGGGTTWTLYDAWKKHANSLDFEKWLSKDRKIVIHGGGQSRRLPAYAPSGKLLIPIPVFRWQTGQRLNQTLLDLQIPLIDKIAKKSPSIFHTILVSGDVYIYTEGNLPDIPEADVVCFGVSVNPDIAIHHGVFICPRKNPMDLEFMLQKPSISKLRDLTVNNLFYIDIGIWLLSDKAVKIIMKKSGWEGGDFPSYYDLYGAFGPSLGRKPVLKDQDISSLSIKIIEIPDGEFYHFGTNREIISSSLSLQNKVTSQSSIWTKNIKPHPAMFVQNSIIDIKLTEDHGYLWVENSNISSKWKLGGNQVITGIPPNNWDASIPNGVCLDIIPVKGNNKYIIRPYGIDDDFKGALGDSNTRWMNKSIKDWFLERSLTIEECGLGPTIDIQDAAIFPVVSLNENTNKIINWIIGGATNEGDKAGEGKDLWLKSERLSANEISERIDLIKLEEQRQRYRCKNWVMLRRNYKKSVFYQVDLDHAAKEISSCDDSCFSPLAEKEDTLLKIHDSMFLSRLAFYKKDSKDAIKRYRDIAFEELRNGILAPIKQKKVVPGKNVYEDQIVWARSPVRIDFAGGWTDTPPYCVMEGGKVVNISIELNGQPPLQAFIRPLKDKIIVLRSIDLGEREVVRTYEELSTFTKVGSPFSIPKASLALAGFNPDFSAYRYRDLKS